jgi:hypothetical protein
LGHEDHHGHHNNAKNLTKSQVRLLSEFRKLWEQHDVWTRSTIVSITFDLPDLGFVIPKLLRNPVDFGRVFEKYYGRRIAAEFTELFTGHLVLAAQLVKAAKAGDNKAVAEIESIYPANAKEYIRFVFALMDGAVLPQYVQCKHLSCPDLESYLPFKIVPSPYHFNKFPSLLPIFI